MQYWITRKQLIWYGHVERMDPTRLPKIMINWKPEGRKKTRPSPKNLERWDIYSHEWKRTKNGRMEQLKAMEYRSRKGSPDVLKPRARARTHTHTHTHTYIYIYIYIYIIWNSQSTKDERHFIRWHDKLRNITPYLRKRQTSLVGQDCEECENSGRSQFEYISSAAFWVDGGNPKAASLLTNFEQTPPSTLPYSQQPAKGSYPEPDQSRHSSTNLLLEDPF